MRVRIKNTPEATLDMANRLSELVGKQSMDNSDQWTKEFSFLNSLAKWVGLKIKTISPEGRTLSVPAERF